MSAARFVLWLFAFQFARNYIEICTAHLLPAERRAERGKLVEHFRKWSVTYVVTAPFGWVCSLVSFHVLKDAWAQWFTYNRQLIHAPGILQSPAGIQPVRVWHYRRTVCLVAALRVDTIGALTALAVAGTIGPLLNSLWRHHRGDDLQ